MRHGGSIEEIVDDVMKKDLLQEVVIPLMANDRQAMDGKVSPHEQHKFQLYIIMLYLHAEMHVENSSNCWEILKKYQLQRDWKR